jgi:hypothetical protein
MYIFIITSKDIAPIRMKLPNSQFEVVRVLTNLRKEAHAPAIARASEGAISVAAVYKLLGRLVESGVVLKREKDIPIGDITARRVFYRVHNSVFLTAINENSVNNDGGNKFSENNNKLVLFDEKTAVQSETLPQGA